MGRHVAIGKFRDLRAVKPLVARLRDPVPYLRKEAARLLAELTGEDLGEDSDAWEQWCKTYADSLEGLLAMRGDPPTRDS